jgi:lipoate-protein ligase A
VAYTPEALVVDHVARDPAGPGGQEPRFEEFGRLFVDVLRGLGVDARPGAVPGEYCPGEHSVNARGLVKLVGTAQRMTRNAWLFSSLVVVADHTLLRPVLGEVYRALGQPFDEASVGSVAEEVGAAVDTAAVERAVLDAYGRRASLEPAPVDAAALALAGDLVPQYRV